MRDTDMGWAQTGFKRPPGYFRGPDCGWKSACYNPTNPEHDAEKHAPGLIRGVKRFSDDIMLKLCIDHVHDFGLVDPKSS